MLSRARISQAVPVRLVRFPKPLQKHHMTALPPIRPQPLETELTWSRDVLGYEIKRFGRLGAYILGRSDTTVRFNPLTGGETYRAFAQVNSEQMLLRFVELHGLLEHEKTPKPVRRNAIPPFELLPEQADGENVKDLLEQARRFREVLQWNTNRTKRPSQEAMAWIERILEPEGLGRVCLDLGSSGLGPAGGSLRPVFRPDTLLTGMLWQLALAISGGKHFRTCTLCGSLFEVGPGSGRRAHSAYCSPEHRRLFHSRNRSRTASKPVS